MATASAPAQTDAALTQLAINTVRTLAMDAVQKADSGHPGTPMALAPLGYVLFTRYLKHDPADPSWPDRDRFVLSCGHASMLLYSLLYLTGYGLTLEDLEQFRQWGSRTPGHPEYGYTPGVETTTGPLGQGMGNAVGMALSEAHLAAVFNRPGHDIVNHRTWFICSDGDLMEGISHEVSSFAGHFRFGKLIGFYDDNHITIDGNTDLTFTDDTAERFRAYGWHVQYVDDVNDLDALDVAIGAAEAETERPSLIIVRTHIGFGSPRVDSNKAHGEALGAENIAITKKNLGWPWTDPFHVPPEVLAHCRQARARGEAERAAWQKKLAAYAAAYPEDAREFERRMRRELPAGWDADLPAFTVANGTMATRAASGAVLNVIAPRLPELMGGSADLTGSNDTKVKGEGNFEPGHYAERYIHFGIREQGMGAIMNGMSVHGGLIPFGGTFLIFSDYMRPPVRLACLMEQRVIYIYTHDSIGLGEDGPTHQPVEQLAALRAIPNFTDMRPADATETVEGWRVAITHQHGPVGLVLTRQKLGAIDRTKYAPASGVAQGAYVLADAPHGVPDVVLMSSGSEVALILDARARLEPMGIGARVVSMPSHALFARQPESYQNAVIPPGIKRLAIEAASPMSWYRWVGSNGVVIGIDRFGASAPYERIYQELGLTVDKIIEAVRWMLKR